MPEKSRKTPKTTPSQTTPSQTTPPKITPPKITPTKTTPTKTTPTKISPTKISPTKITKRTSSTERRSESATDGGAEPKLDIFMVTSEARPFAKTGGLADVCNSLSRALARLGHQVTIVLPRYRGADPDGVSVRAIEVPMGAGNYPVRLIEGKRG